MKRKILVVNLNLAVDKTAVVRGLGKGLIYRLAEVKTLAGGKGVNVARALKTLGVRSRLAGFTAGHNGRWIEGALRREGLESVCVPFSPGESRVCLSVVDSGDGVSTDFNEEGCEVPPAAVKRFLKVFEASLSGCSVAALSGRISPGLPDDFFARLIALAKKRGVVTALDTSGKPLKAAVEAGPSLFKMNRDEFSEAAGEKPAAGAIGRFFRKVHPLGTEYVVVTDGPNPGWAATPQNLWRFYPPPVTLVSAVGAGDSFMAGLLFGFVSGKNRQESVLLALGAAASDCKSLGAGIIGKKECLAFARRAGLERLTNGN